MFVKMLVEDRDLAYLFLDVSVANSPEAAHLYELKFEGVTFHEAMEEEETVWLMNGDKLKVVRRETVDFEDENAEWYPIPHPEIVLDADEFAFRNQE